MRIAIIGPEATGKTELTLFLAQAFDGTGTEEAARRYFIERHLPADAVLGAEALTELASCQYTLEQQAQGNPCFIDASCIQVALYGALSEQGGVLTFDFARLPRKVMDYATQAGYDAFILCRPHRRLEWVADGVRSMPHLRDREHFADASLAFIRQHYPQSPVILADADTWETRQQQAIAGLKKELGL